MTTITKRWQYERGTTNRSYSKTYIGTLVTVVDGETVANSVTDQLLTLSLDVSAVKAFYIVSDQNITIETNNASTPTDTINLVANRPYEWDTDSYDSFLLTADVTAIYLTNASGSTATVYLEAVVDPSP